jgi:hypothetical protein
MMAHFNTYACLLDVQSGKYGSPNSTTLGGVDNSGNPVQAWQATGITYSLCLRACGNGTSLFDWQESSQQFGTWLLPWLALLSQLPYGANDTISNVMALVMTVGSPMLAAFSLAMTVVNGRWIRKSLTFAAAGARADSEQKNGDRALRERALLAARILNNLQQVPINIYNKSALHPLVHLPENHTWWVELHSHLDSSQGWSKIAMANIFWVLIAYIITVADGLAMQAMQNSAGLCIGALWFWLLPIVGLWLKVSPRLNAREGEIARVVRKVNQSNAFVVDERDASARRVTVRECWAIEVVEGYMDSGDAHVYADQLCSSPVHNYSRIFSWTKACQTVVAVFQHSKLVPPLWDSGLLQRVVVAAGLSLALQFGSTGSAIIAAYFTPTSGEFFILQQASGLIPGSLLLHRAWLSIFDLCHLWMPLDIYLVAHDDLCLPRTCLLSDILFRE